MILVPFFAILTAFGFTKDLLSFPFQAPVFFDLMNLSVKMEARFLVSSKLVFSEYLQNLNWMLLVKAVPQKRSVFSACFIFAFQSIDCGRF